MQLLEVYKHCDRGECAIAVKHTLHSSRMAWRRVQESWRGEGSKRVAGEGFKMKEE